MAQARELTGDNYYVVSVIGDGALTGGMAYEAMNNASRMETNFIIVLNDNNMSISENVGGNEPVSEFLPHLGCLSGFKRRCDKFPKPDSGCGRTDGQTDPERQKAVSNSCLSRECFLKIWESPI